MRHIIAMIGLSCVLQVSAQIPDVVTEGMPTVAISRRLCVQTEDGQEAHSVSRTASKQDNAPLKAFGSPKILVCLAQFPDAEFSVATNKDSLIHMFETFFNGKGIGAGDNPYSVSDYFRAMSNEVFNPEFVITEPVTLSQNRKYYGEVSGSNRRSVFRNEALDSLAVQIKDRVGELDTDADGQIDGVIIVFAGCGANVGDDDGMHPACWTTSLTRKGIAYATELVAPELLGMDETNTGGANNAKLNGIGVYVHEMSHMLGLPDFYDINYKAPGMDYWSLMDYGEYWNNGYRPTPYTAYERHFMGWTSLVELSVPTFVEEMKSIADGGSAYVVYNDGNPNEYYILENRNDNDPWSSSLCTALGSGMMIYHVDYDQNAWANNRVNTNMSRQRMTIIPANGHFEICDNLMHDGDKYASELRGHLWPLKDVESVLAYWGIRGNNALTDEERTEGSRIAPAASLHTPNVDGTYLMHKPITGISYDKTMKTASFSFMGGSSTGIDEIGSAEGYAGDAIMTVYSIDGRMVQKCSENALETLPKGIYVIRNLITGETKKCFIGR